MFIRVKIRKRRRDVGEYPTRTRALRLHDRPVQSVQEMSRKVATYRHSMFTKRGEGMKQSDQDMANRVEKDHQELRASIDRLSTLFDAEIDAEGFVCWKLDLLWQLRDFQNQLLKHFDLEEDGGYNADLIHIAPHLASQVAHLEEDHRKIISDLSHILDNLKRIECACSPTLLQVKDRLASLLTFIRKHESEENAILQEAYYQDYGVGD